MARLLDGTDDVIEIVDPDIGTAGPYTACCWVNPDAISGSGDAILAYGDDAGGTDSGWMLALLSGGGLHLRQGNAQAVNSIGTIPTGSWSHTACRRMGSGTALIQIIVDGTQDGSNNTDAPGIQASTVDFRVGKPYDNDGAGLTFFDGKMAEVMFWNVALSDDEIRSAMHGRIPRRDALLIHLPLGLSSPEVDLSGSGFSGVVTGATVADHAPVTRTFDTVPMLPYGVAAPPAGIFVPYYYNSLLVGGIR